MTAFVRLMLVALIISAGLNIYYFRSDQEENRVSSVPDGDSLQLPDGRRVRLLSVDAPEKNRCLAEEAHRRLQELVVGRRVVLSDKVLDDYGRMLANVSVGDTFVNKVLVEEGLAKYSHVKSSRSDELKAVSATAKQEKRGIYSDTCRTSAPSPDCLIKGNTRAGEKIYHLPTCDHYDLVIIDEAFGDSWFCTEKEALNADYTKSSGCP